MNDFRFYSRQHHSVSECYYHIIFSTYKRQPILRISWQAEDTLRKSIEDALFRMNCDIVDVAIQDDHVHILARIPPKLSLADALKRIKGFTSREVRKTVPNLGGKRLWSRSYFTATVGSRYDAVKKYLNKQDKLK